MLIKLNTLKIAGLTMIELMIALAISLVISGAFIASFQVSLRGSRVTVELGRVNTALDHVLELMTKDIQRAGYWAGAGTSSTNPYMVSGSTNIQVNGANDCILLTYDKDGSGGTSLPAIGANDERFGYRLMDNAIQYRPAGSTFACTAASANWTNLTDPNQVKITAFTVTLSADSINVSGGSATDKVEVRYVVVSITGQLVQDTAITRTVTKRIKVYNDRYVP